MLEQKVALQPAYILRYWQYRETSLIVEVFTRDLGRFSVLAKGARKAKSTNLSLLRSFLPVLISCSGKSELKTLTAIEAADFGRELKGRGLYCGYYVNELISHFLHKFDPYPEIYQIYQQCLQALQTENQIEQALRSFEIELLKITGYGLQLSYDYISQQPIDKSKQYHFNPEKGATEADDGEMSGATLIALETQNFMDAQVLAEAKKLMRAAIDFHLQGKEIKSRAVISKIFKQI